MPYSTRLLLVTVLLLGSGSIARADATDEEAGYTMTNDRLDEIIHRLDDQVEGRKGYWRFKVSNLEVTVITDEKADRMRIIVPVMETGDLGTEQLYRIMQANFDTAMDARYAIAKNILWSAYIHPLAALDDEEFLTGLGQTVNLVTNYGTTYSSGALMFGDGDSKSIQEYQLIQDLLEKGQAI